MKDYHLAMTDGALVSRDNPDLAATDNSCMTINGKHFCASECCVIGSTGGLVILAQGYPTVGVVTRLTPEGARAFAAKLIEAADHEEAASAVLANAALAEALARKAPEA